MADIAIFVLKNPKNSTADLLAKIISKTVILASIQLQLSPDVLQHRTACSQAKLSTELGLKCVVI